jgi:CubicO group peptidase (beta-lactamase class C family)
MRDPTEILPRTMALLQKGRQDGLHLGAQLYVSLRGETVADLALGEARPGVTMRTDTLTLWFSSGKPITAVAIAQLGESNRLSMEDRVSRFVPEFASGGKGAVTIRHLLTHTGGFRAADQLPDDLEWGETIDRICATPLETGWVPGEKAGYHLFSSWFVLGEIVRRIDGRPINQYAREMILEPSGMDDSWLGVPTGRLADYGNRIGWVFVSSAGLLAPHSPWNTGQAVSAVRPGGNARGPIRELARFYECLLAIMSNRAMGTAAILKAETIRNLTSRHRVELFDHTFRHTLDFGLGFLLNSNRYGADTVPYGYGRHASESAFGHSGSQSSCAFADPEQQLVVAWTCNGLPGEPRHQKRARDINTALYEDLGLVNAPPGKPAPG